MKSPLNLCKSMLRDMRSRSGAAQTYGDATHHACRASSCTAYQFSALNGSAYVPCLKNMQPHSLLKAVHYVHDVVPCHPTASRKCFVARELNEFNTRQVGHWVPVGYYTCYQVILAYPSSLAICGASRNKEWRHGTVQEPKSTPRNCKDT